MQSLVGQTIVNQCGEYTCWHCHALSGVYISQDDQNSQEWFCSSCSGRMLVTKGADTEISISLGLHGPKTRETISTEGCCVALDAPIQPVFQKPKKVFEPQEEPVIHPPLGDNIFNEDYLKPGEILAGQFFEQNSLAFEKGFSIGSKLIDFRIRTVRGDILWDNADLEECEIDQAALKSGIEGILRFEHYFEKGYVNQLKQKLASLKNVDACAGGVWNPHERLKKIVGSKSKQFKPAKGLYPCVLALYNVSSIPAEYDLIMRQGLGGNRYFQPDRYTAISAIGVLEQTTAGITLRLYHNEYAAVPLWKGAFPLSTIEFDKSNLWDSEIIKLNKTQT